MTRYRKKPVVIEAVRLIATPTQEEQLQVEDFLAGSIGDWESGYDGEILLHTREGTMTAKPGDWMIRGTAGELYPCKPDIFEATYEPA